MAEEKKCLIYYKVGWKSIGFCCGERFDRLETCCEMFERMFLSMGNEKNTDWNNSYMFDAKSGLNLLKKDSKVGLFLCGESIKFCPWCGHAIEIKKSREVMLVQKFCYEEVERSEP
ncbi:MAG: hypothetical protein A3I92_00150 [Candidatus Yanofskybacteria bacterium RIFCSPLOWO2_02_FULL_43_10b]|uniref:Uncharacterized protein n=1 Tax=Candidatus Yanofskybacteria bacterium RIFCSPLOWO2_02_FULL_43_10b TaxID=1802704 RepID=A0A1F8H3D1_9BACT|nr:MAG: hypothetical protein A3I92_00150 [Candidatus Yanofskybacteria bacterium RIFCSPLOWO2_02_FULL_43_10b]